MFYHLVIALILGFSLPHSWANQSPTKVFIPVENVHIPLGFDSNDAVEVILSGSLPNLCYKNPKFSVTKAGRAIHIKATSLYYHPRNTTQQCSNFVQPYTEAVSLYEHIGFLKPGEYDVIVNAGSGERAGTRKVLKIKQAPSSNQDDYVYADVEFVTRAHRGHNKRMIRIEGNHPSDCLELDRIVSVSNGEDTLAVIPILKKNSGLCHRVLVPFVYYYTIPREEANQGNLLIHVRKMNGKSENYIYRQDGHTHSYDIDEEKDSK